MRKYVTSVILAAVLLCTLAIPAFAGEETELLLRSGESAYPFTGTVKEIVRDQDGAVCQLQLEAFGVWMLQQVDPAGGGVCLVNLYYDTVYVNGPDGTLFQPEDLTVGETVTVISNGDFYHTKPVQTLALAVVRGSEEGSVYHVRVTGLEREGEAVPVAPEAPVNTWSGQPAQFSDITPGTNLLVWWDAPGNAPIQRILILDTPGTVTLTRGAFAAMLQSAMKLAPGQEPSAFSDVPDGHPNAEAVRWAASRGYMLGYEDGTFRPDAPMDRQQVVTVLYRASGYSDYRSDAGLPCSDREDVAPWALEAVTWASRDLLSLDQDGRIRPHGRVTVAKADKMMAIAGLSQRDWLPERESSQVVSFS